MKCTHKREFILQPHGFPFPDLNINHFSIISFYDNDYEGFKASIVQQRGSLFILILVYEL